ncbi:MAG: hypothetical protein RLZZ540_1377 [Bacteroidota bacterium]|jgi:hypothetical protein
MIDFKIPISKNKKLVELVLTATTLIISLILIDFYFLPKKTIKENISYYYQQSLKANSYSNNRTVIAYKYVTELGDSFTTEKTYIYENPIEIESTLIFKNITKVYTKNKDYTEKLSSGLNGILLYLYFIFLLSSIISLTILKSEKTISENAFYNIICFNSFILFLCLGILYLY